MDRGDWGQWREISPTVLKEAPSARLNWSPLGCPCVYAALCSLPGLRAISFQEHWPQSFQPALLEAQKAFQKQPTA